MTTPRTRSTPALPRLLGAAVTGAVLAAGALAYLSWTVRRSGRICGTADGVCVTGWNLTAVPLLFAVSLAVLLVVYERLGIGPRLALVPPTLLPAPVLPAAAHASAGWWAVTLTGGAWSYCVALAAGSRYRLPAVAACVWLLLAALVVLYG
ncbi:hypothetical protein [Streptomyces sp. NPDC002250]|uniref:hypothetical protein n=1 Tax=Streptomyces sp. NPDC002250 TaxID=3364641 RepID=UPI003681F898